MIMEKKVYSTMVLFGGLLEKVTRVIQLLLVSADNCFQAYTATLMVILESYKISQDQKLSKRYLMNWIGAIIVE